MLPSAPSYAPVPPTIAMFVGLAPSRIDVCSSSWPPASANVPVHSKTGCLPPLVTTQLAWSDPARLCAGVQRLDVNANMSPIDATCLLDVGLLSTKLNPSSFSTRRNVVPGACFAAPATPAAHSVVTAASAATTANFHFKVTPPELSQFLPRGSLVGSGRAF